METTNRLVISNANDIINNIIKSDDASAKVALIKHCDGNVDILKAFVKDRSSTVKSWVAQCCNGDTDILLELVKSGDKDVRRAVAVYSNGNTEVIKRFLDERVEDVKCYAAQNCTDLEVLNVFANDTSNAVLKAVAENEHCSSEMLAKLSYSSDDCILHDRIARNRNCSDQTLKKLAKGNLAPVYAISENPNCPAELLAEYAKDEDENVRLRVAINPNCTDDILAALANDDSPSVRSSARAAMEKRKNGAA